MNLSLVIHYKNKYKGGHVEAKSDSLDAFDKDGRHCMALRINGAGMLQDMSEQMGLPHRHDLSPIPKDARLYKAVDNKIVKVEEFDEREKLAGQFMDDGRVLSCKYLAEKFEFDKDQRLIK